MLRIYGDIQSGNCYKVKLLCLLLDIQHEWVHMDIVAGDTRNELFLQKNPNGKVPVISLDSGRNLWESNAILNYLAEGGPLLPQDPLQRATVLQWQFFEQYSHEPYIAVARYINKYLGLPAERVDEYHEKQAGGHKALAVMEQHLAICPYFVGETMTIADISLYAYTRVAHEGGFDLSAYPGINRWFARIEAQPKFQSMQQLLIADGGY